MTPIGTIAFRHDVRCARHGFHATGNHYVAFTEGNGLCRRVYRLQAGTAKPVDRRPGHGDRQSGQQYRHACDVAIVFAALIGRSEIDVVDARRIDARAIDDAPDDERREIVGTHRCQCPVVASDWRPQRIGDPHLAAHAGSSAASWSGTSSTHNERCGANCSPSASASRLRMVRRRAPPIARPQYNWTVWIVCA